MALSLAQRGELETIVKLLRAGEKPSISDAVNRRIVKVLRDVLGDLAQGPDSIAFDERPVRSLIEAVLAADTAWACPDCPECPPEAAGIFRSAATALPLGFSMSAGSGIIKVEFPDLVTIDSTFTLMNDAALTEASFPSLVGNSTSDVTPASTIKIDMAENTALTSVSMPGIDMRQFLFVKFTGCTSLTNIDISESIWSPIPDGSTNCDLSASGCALSEDCVNAILIHAASFLHAGAGTSFYIYLNGGTSAAPTGDGLTAFNELIGNSATVETN